MSDCIGAPAKQWLERYVDGALPEEESQPFELHYFDCPVCLAQVQAIQAVQEQLRLHPAPLPQARPKLLSWPALTWGLVGVAAALFIAAFNSQIVGFIQGRHNQDAHINIEKKPAPTPANPAASGVQLASLADLRLPAYHAPILRDGSVESVFQAGMRQYSAGNCPAAIQKLSTVDAHSSDALTARFYSGLCRMSSGDLASAAATLHRVAAAGDSPVQESALYYLAQIALARNDASEARTDLNQVVSLHGDLEQKAQSQLQKLPQ